MVFLAVAAIGVASVSSLSSLLPPTDPSLRYIGRFDLSDPAAAKFQWPLTAIEAAVRCTSPGTTTFKFTTHDPNARFKLLVDGVVVNSTILSAGEHALTAQISGAVRAVRLLKDTEDMLGNPAMSASREPSEEAPAAFHGVVLGGGCDGGGSAAARALAPARTLEVYGDSISCGFGNQALSFADKARCLAGAAIEPITKNDPAIMSRVSSASDAWHVALAQLVGAEVIGLQCISGIGMCKNANNLKPAWPYNMSHFATATLPFQAAAAPWAFSGPAPDVVMINLGTNDYDTSVFGNAPTPEAFEAQYVAFVRQVTAHYDKSATRVLLTCGPMTDRQCGNVSAVADKLNAAGYTAAYASALLPESPGGCKGCALHPTKDEDAAMADRIAPVLKKLAGW